jgi:hypothetical protein
MLFICKKLGRVGLLDTEQEKITLTLTDRRIREVRITKRLDHFLVLEYFLKEDLIV